MPKEILEGLNEQQKKAAKDIYGPVFIIAGPGAGKTSTIVNRIAYMIQEGIDPKKILLFTFTNKAAKELKERIEPFVGRKAKYLTIGTYHSICSRLLRLYASYIDYNNNFTIYDDEDSKGILKGLCNNTKYDENMIKYYISKCKSNFITPKGALNNAENPFEEGQALIYEQYQKALKSANAMDFNDLIFNMTYILEKFPKVREELNQRYEYISVDISRLV